MSVYCYLEVSYLQLVHSSILIELPSQTGLVPAFGGPCPGVPVCPLPGPALLSPPTPIVSYLHHLHTLFPKVLSSVCCYECCCHHHQECHHCAPSACPSSMSLGSWEYGYKQVVVVGNCVCVGSGPHQNSGALAAAPAQSMEETG